MYIFVVTQTKSAQTKSHSVWTMFCVNVLGVGRYRRSFIRFRMDSALES